MSFLNFHQLLKKKDNLLKELELSKIKDKSSIIAAKTDLMNKLDNSIKKNQKKLKFREEDFFYLKNQRDQIISTIKDNNLKIQSLNQKKKDCFSQINKITREMSGSKERTKINDLNIDTGDKKSLSKSETIKVLQQNARDFQYEIRKINSKISESQIKLDDLNPSYDTLGKDYESLLLIIKKDQTNLKTIQDEIKEKLKDGEYESLKNFDFNDITSIKPSPLIEDEIQGINNKLKEILVYNNLLDDKSPENLSSITNLLKEIDNTLISNKENYVLTHENEEIIDSIKNFRKIEILINKLEELLNYFLTLINIKSQFQIYITKEYDNFFIEIKFIRSNKQSLKFDELTTPEKIFFVITFHISIKILLDSKHIIFSNLSVPNEFNKRGSIFRTIRKILPVFEEVDSLKNFNLIFIISNLEMKKPIKNLKIINLEKSD